MAIEKNIKINVDTKGAVSEVDKLDDSFKRLDKETEKTSKGLKDVGDNGGAIAILDSLTGGLATRVRDAYEATKLFNFSLKGTKTALIATGVGLFVIALGTIVSYWSEINDYINGVTKKLERQHEAYQRILGDLDKQLEINKLEQEIAVKKGESTENLLKLEKDILLEKQKTIQNDLASLKIQLEREQSRTREFTLVEKGLTALKAYVLGYDSIGQSILDATTSNLVSEIQKSINELEVLAKQTELALTPEKITKDPSLDPNRGAEFQTGLTIQDQLLFDSKQLLSDKTRELEESDLEFSSRLAEEGVRLAQQRARERIELENQVKEAKIGIAFQTLGLLGSLAKEGSALAKGAAVAQATISGFQGVQNAFTTASASPITTVFPTYPFIQAGLAGAFSAVQIGKILKTPNNGGGELPSSNTGGGGRTPQAPSFNLVAGSASNQISQSLQRGNEPLKAYVTSKDMTSEQELNRNIQGGATL